MVRRKVKIDCQLPDLIPLNHWSYSLSGYGETSAVAIEAPVPTCDHWSSHYDTSDSESESQEFRNNGDKWSCE